MNPFTLFHNYRMFKANNRYSYPVLFFMLGSLKTIFQFSALGVAAWVIYTGATHQFTPGNASLALVSNQSPPTTKQSPVEIPAVSEGLQNARKLTQKTMELKAVATDTLQNKASRLQDSTWVFRQDEDKFTIQYASSPDLELIYESARSFSTTDPVAVFPFKKNRNKRMIYGFSTGIYDNVKSAQQAIAALPESTQALAPWIRPIGELQEQVARTLER